MQHFPPLLHISILFISSTDRGDTQTFTMGCSWQPRHGKAWKETAKHRGLSNFSTEIITVPRPPHEHFGAHTHVQTAAKEYY